MIVKMWYSVSYKNPSYHPYIIAS